MRDPSSGTILEGKIYSKVRKMKTSIKGPSLKKKRNVRSCYAQRANTSTSCEFRKDNYLRNYSRDPPPPDVFPAFSIQRDEIRFSGDPGEGEAGKIRVEGV